MTLNITLVAQETIYQSADFRLTDADTGALITDSSSKLVVVGGPWWQGFISYTGVGRWKDKDTSEWIVSWLTGHELSPTGFVDRIRQKGTSWLKGIERRSGRRWPHSFVAAAFPNDRPTVWVISNFENVVGLVDPFPKPQLDISSRTFGRKPQIVITGQRQSVDRSNRRRLTHLATGEPDPAQIRRILTEVNAAAASSPMSKGTVSPDCSVISFRSDGQGATDLSPTATVEMRTVFAGIPSPSKAELEKMLGFPIGHIIGATHATSFPKKPLPPCKPALLGEDSDSWRLHEVHHPELQSCSVLDLSNSGLILGSGEHVESGGAPAPWVACLGTEPQLCGFIGNAAAINDDGVVAASVEVGDGAVRAYRWKDGEGEELDVYRGDTSGARDIAADGTVVGSVCIDPKDRGQPKFRPAAWLPNGELKVLEDFGFRWGEAVSIVGSSVLVWAHQGPFQVHALLWSLDDGSIREVGKGGVNGNSITKDGLVLGTARNPTGHPCTYVGRIGEAWTLLGTPGAHASSINDSTDIVGATQEDGFDRPWLRRASGEVVHLPYYKYHWCSPAAINAASDLIGGAARADHGAHALLWTPPEAH